jgi:peptidyl-dipeptidase Dcp
MTRHVYLAAALVASCATSPKPQPQVTDAPDRTERDRSMDSHRKPVPMLAFFGVSPGAKVGELGAGGGYSTELFARSVGPQGAVFAQDTPNWNGPGLTKAWQDRLSRPVMKNTTHVIRQWDEPFPPELKDLDAVYSVAVYHDAIAEKSDTGRMNRAVFDALKPGGVYAIIDNSAKPGTGAADVERLHRIDEQLVRDEVRQAGFKLVAEGDFLRNASDPRDWNADSTVNKVHTQDRFALKFVKDPSAVAKSDPPLLAPWTGPFGGVPAFGKFKVADIQTAMDQGIAQELADVDRIATDSNPPDYANTIVALERAGQPLNRANAVFGIYTSTMNDDEMQKIQSDVSPKLAALQDKIVQNPKLFARMAAVYEKRDALKLTPEQQRLLWLDYTGFVRQGAKLDDAAKKQLADLNLQLATLSTKFSQNLLAEEGTQMVVLEKESDLAGLSPALREQAAAAAASHGKPGKWAILNTRSSTDPFLTFSTRRDLREKVWRMFVMRGDNGDAHDNNALIAEILKLRAQKARLLGYPSYAHWKLEDQMAKTPERTVELMEAVWKPAVQRVHEEVADMQAIANKEKAKIRIEPWDYRFYAEKVRKAKYDVDENDVKPYLQLEKLRDGMFWVAGQLFGLKFAPITDGSVPVYHPDVRVWEVQDADGRHVGLWYFDPYARPGKNSGAWMNEYRPQSHLLDQPVIVSNNANFVKGKPGEPILVSWDDAITLFHEFGHALHGLNSNVVYPQLAGTNVPRDYVEFPSQLLERWLPTQPVLEQFALHFQTGQPVPAELVKKIQRTERFNQGFTTVEYLSSALVDMKLHLAKEPTTDPRKFEKDTLAALGMPREIVMRHRTAQFHHIFADGYEAGYYSYLWSATLSDDAYEAFQEGSGPYDKTVAKRLHDDVFSAGNTVDPADAYRAFRGHDAGTGALMRRRGFAPAKDATARSRSTP